jgi:hypothetical protein
MTDSESPGTSASLEITRRREVVDALAKWWVNVDGNRLAVVANGEVVRVAISHGPHKVMIWKKSGRACSNEVDVDLEPGGVGALTCRINPSFVSTELGGLSAFPAQIRILRSFVSSGWVAKGMIELSTTQADSPGPRSR